MKHAWIWVVVIIILAALGYWWYSTQMMPTTATETPGTVAGQENQFMDDSKDGGAEGVESVTIDYTSLGFSPKTLTIPVGTRVTFVNQGAGEMWVASDEHPSHTQYSGTDRESHCPDPGGLAFDQCGNGALYTFTFTKVGTWAYHNHRNDDDRGTIVVTP
jgi:plastocyanin